MIIEWLKFTVAIDQRQRFLDQDAALWTPFLSQCPGYLGKETWLNPEAATEVVLIVRWESLVLWRSIDGAALAAVEAAFGLAVGEGSYQLVESRYFELLQQQPRAVPGRSASGRMRGC